MWSKCQLKLWQEMEKVLPVQIKNRAINYSLPCRHNNVPSRIVIQWFWWPEHSCVCLQEDEHQPTRNLQQNKLDDKSTHYGHNKWESHQPIWESLIVVLDEKGPRFSKHLKKIQSHDQKQFIWFTDKITNHLKKSPERFFSSKQ